jgi:hypothetical protein
MSEGHSGVHGSVPSDGLGERSRPRRRARRFPTALVVVALAGVAVGIAGTLLLPRLLPPASTPAPSIPTTSATPTTTPVPLPTNTALTPPGTKLALGKPGTVQLATGPGHTAVVTLTPSSPVPASAAEMDALRTSVPQLAGMRVFFTQVQLTKVSGDPLAGVDLAPVLQSITRDGVAVTGLPIANWARCGALTLTPDVDSPGQFQQVCLASAASAAPDSLVPAGLRFTQPGGPYTPATSGVTWMP